MLQRRIAEFKEIIMLESTTDPAIRRSFEIAHEERARAFREAWNWLFTNHR